MSKVFNMVGGGGGPAASIFVTGLSETDTVTATNGDKTKTGVWTEKDSVSGFLIDKIRDFGTWTVTATDGTKIATQNVLVDVITEYEIEMDYTMWLYKYGNEYKSVTGGWIASSMSTQAGVTKNDTNIYINGAVGTDAYAAIIGTANKLNIDDYSTIYFDLSCSQYNSGSWLDVGMAPDLAWYEHTLPYRTTISMGSSGVFSVDIKDATGEYIIRTMGYRCNITVNRVWLE